MDYYGNYQAATTSQTGCVKQFVTVVQSNANFPPQVNYACNLCHRTHGFRFMRAHMVSTPRQRLQFFKHCEDHSVEMDVELP